ncbi:DEAD/DEAH box helicase [Methylolobus aquaticus]|nr:DEAD/DEAH box helicase [Methylolobus aquaticus]
MFSAAAKAWFDSNFPAPTEVQRRGWPILEAGRHALLLAPTGSGKTLAAFLAAIDSLFSAPAYEPGIKVLYISPLKALVHDIERNLRAPLVGICRTAERLGLPARSITVDVRTGDTPQRERLRQAREPADILVTTPESLYLLLGAKARNNLRGVRTVIVDEVHALAPVKRGVHLALSLERLSALCEDDPQRVGLSATVHPAAEVAAFLGGDRPVEIVDASAPPQLDLRIVMATPESDQVASAMPEERLRGGSILGELYSRELGRPKTERGIWPAIYPRLLDDIRANRSTLIFVNSRGLCERLAQRLNDEAGEDLVRAHHGSVSPAQRAEIEDQLKRGGIRGIVATSSLELGIDMGAIDLVVLVESPGSVARGLQRVGRAGHQVGQTSVGRIYPKFRGDLLECAVIGQRMLHGEIEPIQVPQNVLDVLAQQVVAQCVVHPSTVDELLQCCRRAHPYRTLSRPLLEAVLDMLAGRYTENEFADLRPLLAWDRAADRLSPRRGAAMRSRLNAGTIPDRGNYGVYLVPNGPRVGELDEEMVFETRTGDCVLLGATTWRVEEITRDRVLVSPAPGEPGRLPFWRGEGPGRPLVVGRALGELLRELSGKGPAQRRRWLQEETPLDELAAQNLAAYLDEQQQATGTLPSDRCIVVERFRDELGDWRVCILSPFGARIHGPWAMAIQHQLSLRSGFEVQVMYTDDGIVLRLADVDELPALDGLLPDPDEARDAVTAELANTALFAGLFRENAVRSMVLPRRRPGSRNPLWVQRLKAQGLLAAVKRYPAFPLVLETYRQALCDQFDLGGFEDLMSAIRSRTVQVIETETRTASPFARSLVFAYIAAYLYEQDAPLAERKAQALTVDSRLLAELLGQAQLRELLDEHVIDEIEQDLQHLADGRRARDGDELHDVLRRLGDLGLDEIRARCDEDPGEWLLSLAAERRACKLNVAGEQRWIAAEDAGLFRDALGTVPPSGLPESFLASVERPLPRLCTRFARTHGPFVTARLAARYGLRPAQVDPVLSLLVAEGMLVRGEIRPAGSEAEWCDAEVLRRIKRGTVARLRNEAAALDASVLGIFLPQWHGIGAERGGPQRLLEVIGQLEGLALPWSLLDRVVLPRRVPGYSPDLLDQLAATGAIVWVGRSALGPSDGRIALYRRDHARALIDPKLGDPPDTALHRAIIDYLRQRGASFLFELESAARDLEGKPTLREFTAALWDLVWAGWLTNDTFAPLRALGRRAGSAGNSGRRGAQALAGGRWSLVSQLSDPNTTVTAQALARAQVLLERYGLVSREIVQTEDFPGGYAPIHTVLRSMEEGGKLRRGYFVEGLAGSQFAYRGAIDRLRACNPADEPDEESVMPHQLTVLAALDPANPYGGFLPWPECEECSDAVLRRVPGAWVVLYRGRLAAYAAQNGRQITLFDHASFPDLIWEAVFAALNTIAMPARRGFLVIEKLNGRPVHESPLYARLRRAGFESDHRGLVASPAMGAPPGGSKRPSLGR